jgi:hypothetical protein
VRTKRLSSLGSGLAGPATAPARWRRGAAALSPAAPSAPRPGLNWPFGPRGANLRHRAPHGATFAAKFLKHFKRRFGFKFPARVFGRARVAVPSSGTRPSPRNLSLPKIPSGVILRRRPPLVPVVQPADFGNGDNRTRVPRQNPIWAFKRRPRPSERPCRNHRRGAAPKSLPAPRTTGSRPAARTLPRTANACPESAKPEFPEDHLEGLTPQVVRFGLQGPTLQPVERRRGDDGMLWWD